MVNLHTFDLLAKIVQTNGATVHADDVIALVDTEAKANVDGAAASAPLAMPASTSVPGTATAAVSTSVGGGAPASATANFDVIVIGSGPGGYIDTMKGRGSKPRGVKRGFGVSFLKEHADERA
ncbi:hypothetical protein [Cupriavidus consociatus]|uniref:hypothetical protein n=1 Tax=Cupriavidus consociatus TaxID=2821357 RepID=UPI001AE14050|nr:MULTISPECIES: hypothetical protein [unclassified Cupriavidus]MBP0625271.1 hypothetical protein [Cupriavidus sp. LEh25]MDK2662006.1 hypothetical protein [Cupriavidus sp. LEh21]